MMFLILLLVTASLALDDYADNDCKESNLTDLEIENACQMTIYDDYVSCIRKHRVKRSLGCNNRYSCEETNSCATSCDECQCEECEGCEYTGSCSSCCTSCCTPRYASCTTNHCCHKVCRANCRNSSCRNTCKKTCEEHVKTETQPHHTTNSHHANNTILTESQSRHNITTIIHLNNVVNNTNVIDAPIRVNTTNVNNITLPTSWEDRIYQNGSSERYRSDCCSVLSPRLCQRTDRFPFLRCFHYRYRMCGHMCYSNVMHTYSQNICTQQQQGGCHQRHVLVPQPSPRCAYSSQWPYVNCGLQSYPNCEGCYGHHFGQERINCNPFCYDEGFGAGPYYRQGPLYQPSYSPVPPCYMTGSCGSPFGYQPYAFPSYSPGMIQGMPGMPQVYPGLPYPYPAFSPIPYPMTNNGFSPVYDDKNIRVENVENASVSGPVLVNEPFLFNQLAFPNLYPQVIAVDNITHEPVIQAEVNTNANHSNRYAQIKIVHEKDINAV